MSNAMEMSTDLKSVIDKTIQYSIHRLGNSGAISAQCTFKDRILFDLLEKHYSTQVLLNSRLV
jgi:hypothetical protein